MQSLHLGFLFCFPPVSVLYDDVFECSTTDIQVEAPAGGDDLSGSSQADSDDCIVQGTAAARKVSAASIWSGEGVLFSASDE